VSPGELLLILLFLTSSAFLSLSEISLVGISKIRLRHLVEKGSRRAKIVQGLVSQIDTVITTILVGSNFINAALTGLLTAACISWLGEGVGVLVASLLAGGMILLLTDIIPKVYAARYADRVSLQVAPVMRGLVSLFRPMGQGVTRLSHVALKTMGISMPSRSPLVTEEEIKLMIEMGKEEGVLGEEERMMLHRIFAFGDLKARDVMIPREQMVALPLSATPEEVLDLLTEEGHSRVPVYEGSLDTIRGILYAQGLLHLWRHQELIVLPDLLHAAYTVPETKRVTELLQEFQRMHVQIAIVTDAQGQTAGLVTLEDLLEEIVGEIGGV